MKRLAYRYSHILFHDRNVILKRVVAYTGLMQQKMNPITFLFHGLCLSMFILPCASRAADLTLAQAQAGAAKGDAEAEFVLGKAYFKGDGVPQDYAKAF